MAFALLALLWSWFGKIDIVAAASGKTVSGGRSKTIQPLETVVVKAVHVRDGQHVKQGETLAELEAVGTDSDVVQSEQALQAAQLSNCVMKRYWRHWKAVPCRISIWRKHGL